MGMKFAMGVYLLVNRFVKVFLALLSTCELVNFTILDVPF